MCTANLKFAAVINHITIEGTKNMYLYNLNSFEVFFLSFLERSKNVTEINRKEKTKLGTNWKFFPADDHTIISSIKSFPGIINGEYWFLRNWDAKLTKLYSYQSTSKQNIFTGKIKHPEIIKFLIDQSMYKITGVFTFQRSCKKVLDCFFCNK